ncbi:MAG: hypothetical protein AAB403_00765 [Planctomycetota bacterium]
MRITGRTDLRDRMTWVNWAVDNPTRGRGRWDIRLLACLGLAVPPIVFAACKGSIHWGTYIGSIICWIFYFAFCQLVILLVARRRAKAKTDSAFEVGRENGLVRLRIRDHALELPVAKFSVIRLPENLILAVDKFPVCITPRNGNIDEGKTSEDILKLVTAPEPPSPADGAIRAASEK